MYELDVVTPESLARFVHRWYGLPDRPPVDLPVTPPPGPLPGPPPGSSAGQATGSPGHDFGSPGRDLGSPGRDLGPPDQDVGSPGHGIPEPLAEWHRVAARYTLPLSRDHVMRPWSDLKLENGMFRFWEGASDWYSVPEAAGADPEVYENDEFPTGLSLSRFLVYATVYEATYAPLHGLVRMAPTADQLRAVKVRLRELDDALWAWPDPETRYYGDDDLLGHLGPDRVVLAARHRDALGRFDALGIDWDWDTRTA